VMVVNDNAYGLVERGAPIASKPAPTGIALTVFLTIFEAEKKGPCGAFFGNAGVISVRDVRSCLSCHPIQRSLAMDLYVQ
jgi:hypothetical protein